MEEAPFKLKDRKTVCENSVFRINFDHLIDGELSLVKDYLVVEPRIKNSDGVTGVAILPYYKEKYGLVHIYRHPVGEYGWEVPRGFIDKDEVAEEAAIRELKEETGVICDKSILEYLGTICPEPGVISAKVNLYKAVINNDEIIQSENELGHVEFNWFSSTELKVLIQEQLINDATTLTACLKVIRI
jgi:ADP-ribose diphosphatase